MFILGSMVVMSSHTFRVPDLIPCMGYCLCGVLHVLPILFIWVLSRDSLISSHLSKTCQYMKLPVVVNLCMHVAICWTGVPSRLYSPLIASVTGIGSGSPDDLTAIKSLLVVNE